MPYLSPTLAAQYLRLAIWHPHERALTALALRVACEAEISCTAILEDLWPRLHGRIEAGHAMGLAENLAHYGEFAAVGFLREQRWQHLSWKARLQLLKHHATSQFKHQVINDVNRYSAVEHMVQCLCDSASLHVRSAIEIVLQELPLESAEFLAAAFPAADPDARVRIIRLLAPLTAETLPVTSSTLPVPQQELRRIIRDAGRATHRKVRNAATTAMQGWSTEDAPHELLALLIEPDPHLAQCAADATIVALQTSRFNELISALLQLEISESPGHVDLVLHTVRRLGSRSAIRSALNTGTVHQSLEAHIAELLESWDRDESQPAVRLESLDWENVVLGGPHCPGCAMKAAQDPREWLCR